LLAFRREIHTKLAARDGRLIRSNFQSGQTKVIPMLLVTSNKSKQLLQICYIGQVRLEDLQSGREDLTTQLKELSPGFRLLADFSQMESMGLDCAPELGRMMDLIGQAGVALVVRVIPEPSRDIGMNILTVFHYPHRPRVVACQNLTEAARSLELQGG
jgi:hypothetical protein